MELEWKFLSKREAYRGYVVLSDHEVELPNGEVTRYVVDESIPFGVAVLGLTDLEFLHTFYQDPSRTSYPIHLYFCRSVVPGVQTVDPQEIVHTVEMSVNEFDAKVREGEIIDPPLLIARLVAGLKGLIPLA